MSLEGWRETWALALLEASAVSSRSQIWFRRYALAAGGLALLYGVLAARIDAGPGRAEIREIGEQMADAMSLSAYVIAAVLAPLLAAGAVEAAKRTGMLDLVISSPLPERRILTALACGRLLATAQFLLPALLLAAIPVHLAGWRILGQFLWTAALAAIAAAVSTAVMILLASSRRNAVAIGTRLLSFVLVTPVVSVPSLVCLPIAIVGVGTLGMLGEDAGKAFGILCAGGMFPFWSLGIAIFTDAPNCVYLACGAALVGLVTIRLAYEESSERFATWVEQLAPSSFREGRSYNEAGSWRRFLPSLRGRRERAEGEEENTEEPEDRAPLTSLARSRLLKVSGFERWVYLLTGRNPFVLRCLGRIEENSTVGACFGIFAVYSLTALVQAAASRQQVILREPDGSPPGVLALGLGLLLAAYLSVDEVAEMLPSRSTAGLRESLLSSPLGGLDVVIGAMGAVFLRVYPLLGALLLVGFLPIGRGFDIAVSAALFALVIGAALLAWGISLWASLFLERRAERVVASLAVFLVCAVLLDAVLRLLESAQAPGPRTAGQLLGAAYVAASSGLILAASFAVCFRRVVRA